MKISSDEQKAMTVLLQCAEDLGFEVILVGAGARRLLFELQHGRPAGRATTDWDWAVWVRDWSQFEDLKSALLKTGFSKSREEHRIVFPGPVHFDFIPFGPISGTSGSIEWPASGMEMDVLGFEEAHQSLQHVDVGDIRIPTVSMAGLCLLKTLSYGSGSPGRRKDLLDLLYILRNYLEIALDTINEDHALLLEKGLSFDVAGAYLLGRDIHFFATPGTLVVAEAVISRIVANPDDHLLPISIRSLDEDTQLKETQLQAGLLMSFLDGLKNS